MNGWLKKKKKMNKWNTQQKAFQFSIKRKVTIGHVSYSKNVLQIKNWKDGGKNITGIL